MHGQSDFISNFSSDFIHACMDEVTRAIQSFPNGLVGGPGGLRPMVQPFKKIKIDYIDNTLVCQYSTVLFCRVNWE